jgi:UDP:flavonoid glycosyltransferase YjiC (YdhE family)
MARIGALSRGGATTSVRRHHGPARPLAIHDHDEMRILVTATPGLGHLLPVLPLAAAAAARGHDVAVATGAELGPIVERAGLRHLDVGPPSLGAAFSRIDDFGSLAGRERLLRIVTQGFATILATEFADGVLGIAERWRPDVVVHEDMELGSWIAAERLRIPHVTVQATAWRPPIRRLAAEAQNVLRSSHGLAAQPDLAGLDGALWFTTRPPSLRYPAAPMPPTLRELRPEADDRVGSIAAAGDALPDWLAREPDRPRVAVTLGTVNANRVDLIHPILDGLAGLDVEIVVALGADPATVGPVPANVRVERYVPMSDLLPRSAFVVHHAGSGTMLAAAGTGRPMLLVPIAADQPENAALCVNAGIAIALDVANLAAADVRTAAVRLLGEPAFAVRAAAVAAEVASMPDAAAALAEIEAIA